MESQTKYRWIQNAKDIHYDQTYAPVTSWKSIRLLLIMVAKYKWKSKQLDDVSISPSTCRKRNLHTNSKGLSKHNCWK
jgi:hypothetical protein